MNELMQFVYLDRTYAGRQSLFALLWTISTASKIHSFSLLTIYFVHIVWSYFNWKKANMLKKLKRLILLNPCASFLLNGSIRQRLRSKMVITFELSEIYSSHKLKKNNQTLLINMMHVLKVNKKKRQVACRSALSLQ